MEDCDCNRACFSLSLCPGLAFQALSDAIALDERCAEKVNIAKTSADLKTLFAGAQKHPSGAIEFKGEDADGSSAGLIATSRVLKGLLALSDTAAELNVSRRACVLVCISLTLSLSPRNEL